MDFASLVAVSVVTAACSMLSLLLVNDKRGISNPTNPSVLKDIEAYSFTGLTLLSLLHPSGIPVLAAVRELKAIAHLLC